MHGYCVSFWKVEARPKHSASTEWEFDEPQMKSTIIACETSLSASSNQTYCFTKNTQLLYFLCIVDTYYPYYYLCYYYYFTCYKEINVWILTEENLLPGLLPAKAAAAWKLSAALPSAAAVPSRVKSENAAAAAS